MCVCVYTIDMQIGPNTYISASNLHEVSTLTRFKFAHKIKIHLPLTGMVHLRGSAEIRRIQSLAFFLFFRRIFSFFSISFFPTQSQVRFGQ